MTKLKIALSILALLVMGAAGVQTFGSWTVPPGLSEVLIAVAGLLGYLGYQPFALPQKVGALFATVGMMTSGFVASHATTWGDGHKHLALVVVGFAGAVLWSLGRGLAPRPAADPAVPPPTPKG